MSNPFTAPHFTKRATGVVGISESGKILMHAVISEVTAARNAIVAAVSGKKIKVFAYVLINTTAQIVTWESGTTALSGAMALASNGGITIAVQPPECILETVAGEALNITQSAATQLSGHLSYWDDDDA